MIDKLYVENGVGRRVAEALNAFTALTGVTATFQHDVHPAMQVAQNGDEWWIEEASVSGYAILTQDKAILQQGPERDALCQSGGILIAYARANYDVLVKLGCFALNWPVIKAMLDNPGPQAIVLQKGGHEIVDLSSG
ncbi:hypothetical protein [Patulibacter sp. SYSU D01012]|uniref:PIN-like domain-containing protein n=1 Tax=Patulibacter sp. SYSU D01012 TaxID=2817381 RepID=UPI001B303D75